MCLFTDDMIIFYTENPMKSTKTPVELISKFNKVAR